VPEPPADGPVDATAWSPACPQPHDAGADILIGPGVLGELPFDEHCQRLSVTAPADAEPDERLPVMVQIHGGAYVYGAGDAPLNDPAALVREQRVVAVTVTYRLGCSASWGARAGGRPTWACSTRSRPCAGCGATSPRSTATRTRSRSSAPPRAATPSPTS
jgi:para-nitrobenzyl esterase